MEKLTAEKVRKMLQDKGIHVTIAEAAQIAEFLRLLANSVVTSYLSNSNRK